jgi:peptide-methionine (S)-S-oxide reductase
VIRTKVGYAGGEKQDPTYRSLGDHSETVQIEYDPAKISYGDLLDVFWDSHDATLLSFSRQYMSVIFYHNDEQKRLAMDSKEREETRRKNKVFTDIVPATEFYLAEDYHQKYYLQRIPGFTKEFRGIYPDIEDFVSDGKYRQFRPICGSEGKAARVRQSWPGTGLCRAQQSEVERKRLLSELPLQSLIGFRQGF